MAVNLVYITLSTFIFQGTFKVSPITFGWLSAIVGTTSIITKIIAPFFIIKSNNNCIMRYGIFFLFLSGLTLLIAICLNWMNIPIVLIAASFAMVALILIGNTAMSMALSPFHEKRGSAGALYSTFQMLFSFVISAMAASIPYTGITTMMMLYFLLAVFAMLVYKLFLKRPA